MTVGEMPACLKANWLSIRETLLAGRYQPQPVTRGGRSQRPAAGCASWAYRHGILRQIGFVTLPLYPPPPL